MPSGDPLPDRLRGATLMDATQHIATWLSRIQSEYREMPGLNLTKPQMQRLWGLESYVCDALIDSLVAARVLRRTIDGTYVAAGR
jgi:hypothetical protein